jgi:hypothetical protein
MSTKPVAWMHKQGDFEEPSFRELDDDEISRGWEQYPLYTTPPRIKFPVALRKMWTGAEVQQWLDENVNKE